MTDESAVGENGRERAGERITSTPNGRRSLSLGELSGLVALFGAMGYVLGILALWVPIFRNYTYDIANSWYAVSMVPKTIVIGQGFIRLCVPAAIYTVLIAVALSPDYLPKLNGYWRRTVLQITALVFAYLSPIGCIATLEFIGEEQFAIWEWTIVLIAPVPTIIALAWATSLLRRHSEYSDDRRRNVLKAVTAVLVSSFVASFLVFVLIAHRPALPWAELAGSHSVNGGRLLTHSEGYWYILDPDGKVFAIPDNEVRTAKVFPMGF